MTSGEQADFCWGLIQLDDRPFLDLILDSTPRGVRGCDGGGIDVGRLGPGEGRSGSDWRCEPCGGVCNQPTVPRPLAVAGLGIYRLRNDVDHEAARLGRIAADRHTGGFECVHLAPGQCPLPPETMAPA